MGKLQNMSESADSEKISSQHQSEVMSEEAYKKMKERRSRLQAQRLSVIKQQIDRAQGSSQRRQRWLILFLIEVFNTMFGILVTAKLFINEVDGYRATHIDTLLISMGVSFIVTLWGSLQATDLSTVIKLLVHLDSVPPTIIASFISLYYLIDFRPNKQWRDRCLVAIYPIWMICIAGSLRVHIKCEKISSWKIILYKVCFFVTGLISFYTGFTFMNGTYKFSNGYLVELQTKFKYLILLFVFGMMDFSFQLVKRMTDFDQTSELKHDYCFKNEQERTDEMIAKAEMKQAEREHT